MLTAKMSKHEIINGRQGETIGGGYMVFRRGKRTGRVSIRTNLPFEHADAGEAFTEARRLAGEHPEESFEVFQSVGMRFTDRCDDEGVVMELING